MVKSNKIIIKLALLLFLTYACIGVGGPNTANAGPKPGKKWRGHFKTNFIYI
jgi:hypothetical protein